MISGSSSCSCFVLILIWHNLTVKSNQNLHVFVNSNCKWYSSKWEFESSVGELINLYPQRFFFHFLNWYARYHLRSSFPEKTYLHKHFILLYKREQNYYFSQRESTECENISFYSSIKLFPDLFTANKRIPKDCLKVRMIRTQRI